MQVILRLCAWLCVGCLASCGGGGGGGGTSEEQASSSNELVMRVEAWRGSQSYPNQGFVTVQVCEPGTNRCQAIDHVLVDTGSYGLRVLASELHLSLTPSNVNNQPLAECAQFVSGYTWGGVYTADVGLGNQTAPSVAVQLIDASYAQLPASCSSAGGIGMNDADALGAKGILGVGSFQQDCPVCAYDNSSGHYYVCANNTCTPSLVPLASQVSNPVAMLPTNNNGVVINLPAVALSGQVSIQGKLILGINSNTNNRITTETVFDLDDYGYLTTFYNNQTLTQSYIDSGSNGLFFPDPSLPLCQLSTNFYCPSTELAKTATIISHSRQSSAAVTFYVGNTDLMEPAMAARPDLAGAGDLGSFAWGLPFFYGRKVFVSIAGKTVLGSQSPRIAF